jgi:glyoxylase-like metal-dependent hydrolase (beta-lactamase superfamily II)
VAFTLGTPGRGVNRVPSSLPKPVVPNLTQETSAWTPRRPEREDLAVVAEDPGARDRARGAARIHDHWAIYDGDLWISRDAEGATLSPSVRLLATPGHTREDITTVASAADAVYACTHAWWGPDGPADDPLATDPSALHASRSRILDVATVIVPGHGPAFRPDPGTPR